MNATPGGEQRHALTVRITHWINAVSFCTLVFSGYFILSAHPRLYWGENGYFGAPSLFDLPLALNLDDSGWSRSLHFLAAWALVINGIVYLLWSVFTGHLRRRLLPTAEQLQPRHLVDDILRHLRFEHAPDAASRYNVLQKITYLVVIYLLFPIVLLTGLTMSPAVTAACPWLFDLFGGRQSARTLHFFTACTLILFLAVHLGQVILIGFRSEVLAMITGKSAPRKTT